MTPGTAGAVLFDFGGTLDADGVPWKERFFRICVDEGIAGSPSAFDPVFYAADDALVGAVPADLSLEDTVGRLASGVARGLGVDASRSARVADRFLGEMLLQVRENTPLLERLAARHRLGIVSNFYGNLATVCHNAGIRPLFGAIIDSARVGATKPDPRIFQCALDALGVAPADAVFVGDSPTRDMAGARAIGMRHIWLAGTGAPGAVPCCPGDVVVTTLRAVEDVLA